MSTPNPETVKRLSRPGRINPDVLVPGLPKRGRIKIGGRGDARKTQDGRTWYPPVKYENFEIRQLQRGSGPDTNYLRDEQIHNIIGDKPTRLPIKVLYNRPELNFTSRLGIYGPFKMRNAKGDIVDRRGVVCGGDGVSALRKVLDQKKVYAGEQDEVACPCELYADGRCKPNGVLNAIIDVPGVFGIYQYSTTGKRTCAALEGSMEFIQDACYGQLAGLPLDLVLRFVETVTNDGTPTTVPVVTIEPRDGDLVRLQEMAREFRRHKTELDDQREREAARMAEGVRTSNVFGQTPDEEEEHAEEFFPEGNETGAPAAAATPATDQPKQEESKPAANGKPATPDISDLI